MGISKSHSSSAEQFHKTVTLAADAVRCVDPDPTRAAQGRISTGQSRKRTRIPCVSHGLHPTPRPTPRGQLAVKRVPLVGFLLSNISPHTNATGRVCTPRFLERLAWAMTGNHNRRVDQTFGKHLNCIYLQRSNRGHGPPEFPHQGHRRRLAKVSPHVIRANFATSGIQMQPTHPFCNASETPQASRPCQP